MVHLAWTAFSLSPIPMVLRLEGPMTILFILPTPYPLDPTMTHPELRGPKRQERIPAHPVSNAQPSHPVRNIPRAHIILSQAASGRA